MRQDEMKRSTCLQLSNGVGPGSVVSQLELVEHGLEQISHLLALSALCLLLRLELQGHHLIKYLLHMNVTRFEHGT